jgi:predicted aspartyl protease
MVIKIILTVLIVLLAAFVVNAFEDYSKRKNRLSIKESIDLVGLPIITFNQGDKKYNFILDTGSNISVINSHILKDLEYSEVEGTSTVYGHNGEIIPTYDVEIPLTYKENTYRTTFRVLDLNEAIENTKAESGVRFDGLLGSLFMQQYGYTIDFDKLEVYSK